MTPNDDAFYQDDAFYRKVQRRITIFILVLAVSGALAGAIWKGLGAGGGFLTGAAVSYLSFWRWEKIVNSLGARPKVRGSLWWMLRSLDLVALAYVIIRILGLSLPAATVGLLVPAAAVMLELIYELIYARS